LLVAQAAQAGSSAGWLLVAQAAQAGSSAGWLLVAQAAHCLSVQTVRCGALPALVRQQAAH
jgi:hypothetical protein